MSDTSLLALVAERKRLLRELAPVLTRVGGNHPKRKQVNARRALSRKDLRKKLRINGNAIMAHVMTTYGPHSHDPTSTEATSVSAAHEAPDGASRRAQVSRLRPERPQQRDAAGERPR